MLKFNWRDITCTVDLVGISENWEAEARDEQVGAVDRSQSRICTVADASLGRFARVVR